MDPRATKFTNLKRDVIKNFQDMQEKHDEKGLISWHLTNTPWVSDESILKYIEDYRKIWDSIDG